MRSPVRLSLAVVCIAIVGCWRDVRAPKVQSIISAEEAREAFESQDGLQRALERRWSISAIKQFCIPARRHDPEWQNLVTDTDTVWSGILYSDADTGFEKINWYATVENGRAVDYSVNASAGWTFGCSKLEARQRFRSRPI